VPSARTSAAWSSPRAPRPNWTANWPASWVRCPTRRLRNLLGQHEDTAWFLDKVLADKPDYRPPYYQTGYRTRGTASPAGDAMPIAAPRYNCPVCGNYVWYRPDVGTPVPRCRTDDVLLAQA
jgi:hypothetical protein